MHSCQFAFAIRRSTPVSRSLLAAAKCYETTRDAFARANSETSLFSILINCENSAEHYFRPLKELDVGHTDILERLAHLKQGAKK